MLINVARSLDRAGILPGVHSQQRVERTIREECGRDQDEAEGPGNQPAYPERAILHGISGQSQTDDDSGI